MTAERSFAAAIQAKVDRGALAGAAMRVWRDGNVIETPCFGWRDVQARLPIQRDTLFRIASMTKPITSTAALMLFEEGRFALRDPITRWAPELSDMRVLRAPEGPLDQTVPAGRQITFEDLLTHRSGLTYGDFHSGPIRGAYQAALGGSIDSGVEPDDWIARLAQLPLIDQPGATFHYGHSTDLLGFLIARIADAPLEEVLRRRIFGPLGMADTSFTVAREKAHRRAALYGFDDSGALTQRATVSGGATMPERPEDMTYVSGGQGLWSTVDDYGAFARMFVGAGTVDGVRLLRPETLATMTTNQLTPAQRENATLLGLPVFLSGHGYGMGVAVVMEPKQAEPTICGGGVGAVGWSGGFGGWWQADPDDQSVLVFLAHNLVEPAQIERGIGFEVYGAIRSFQAAFSPAP
jgi:CubicO group peptidase (beta-lactamase class C family)